MPDFDAYAVQTTPMWNSWASLRAQFAWQRINEAPVSAVVMRGSTNLTAQTVRIDANRPRETAGEAGTAAVRSVTITGVRSHPTVTDTDLAKGDRIYIAATKVEYRVIDVTLYPGEIQATAEATK